MTFLEKFLFTKHLGVILKSGIPIAEAISIIKDQSTNNGFKMTVTKIEKDIINGTSLYQALKKFPRIFDSFYLHLVKIGEDSGNLDTNLNYLATALRKNYDFKKKVQGALLYPEIILVTALLVGGGISIFVLPQLIDLFKSLDITLPLSTQILLFVANLMKNYGLYIFTGILLFIFIFKLIINQISVKPHWHKILLSAPIFGKFLQYVEMSSMCRNLGMMLKSGLPVHLVFDTQIESTSNLVYRRYLEIIRQGVGAGRTIEEEIIKNKMIFIPNLATKMIGVGEKTGKLDESLLYLGDFFEDEVDQISKDFSTVLEPIILLIVGFMVAYLAMAIISPIYEFTGSINR